MSDVVKNLRERRATVFAESRALTDKAIVEKRAFTAEEQQSYDRMTAEINSLDQRAKDLLDGERRAKETEDAFRELGGEQSAEQRGGGDNVELRAFLRGDQRDYTVKPEQIDFRDLSSGSTSTGGATIARTFYGRLMEHLIDTSGILLAGPLMLNTSGGEVIDFPKTTDHGEAQITPEGEDLEEDDPQFGKLSLGAYKFGRIVHVPTELTTDNGVDLEGYLAKASGTACGNALGKHLVIGDGSDKPRGVTLDTTAGATGPTGVSGAFGAQNTVGQGYDLIIKLYHSVIAPYRRSASCGWVFNDQTAGVLRSIKDDDGNYVLRPGLAPGAPDTMEGKPVHYDPFVDDIGIGKKPILFGDWNAYVVRLAGGFRFEQSRDYKFGSDMVSFRAIVRGDGGLADLTGAIKHYQGGAS